jgi:hypothetical protein
MMEARSVRQATCLNCVGGSDDERILLDDDKLVRSGLVRLDREESLRSVRLDIEESLEEVVFGNVVDGG